MAHVVCERSMHNTVVMGVKGVRRCVRGLNTVVMGVEGVRRCARGLAQCSMETLQYSRRTAYRTGTGRQTARQQSAARKSNRVPPSIATTLSRVWCERAATYVVCFLSLRIVSLKNQRHAKLIWCATCHVPPGPRLRRRQWETSLPRPLGSPWCASARPCTRRPWEQERVDENDARASLAGERQK